MDQAIQVMKSGRSLTSSVSHQFGIPKALYIQSLIINILWMLNVDHFLCYLKKKKTLIHGFSFLVNEDIQWIKIYFWTVHTKIRKLKLIKNIKLNKKNLFKIRRAQFIQWILSKTSRTYKKNGSNGSIKVSCRCNRRKIT